MLCVGTELLVHQALKHSSNVDCSHWWDTFMAFIFIISFHIEIVKEKLPRRWLIVSMSHYLFYTAHTNWIWSNSCFAFYPRLKFCQQKLTIENLLFLMDFLNSIFHPTTLFSQFVLLNILLHILTLQLKLHLLCSKTTLTHHLFLL